MNQQLQQLFTDLDTMAGQVDKALAEVESMLSSGRTDLIAAHVNRAHDLNARWGRLLAAAAKWDREGQHGEIGGNVAAAPVAHQTGLPPGMKVADVGEQAAQWRGSIDGKSLSLENWAYFQRHNLGGRAG